MGHFIGGSAFGMARDIAEGFILLNDTMLRKFNAGESQQLLFELDRLAKDARAEQVAQEDAPAIQKKSRRISRINQAMMILKNRLATKH
jgi:hypothetical protein